MAEVLRNRHSHSPPILPDLFAEQRRPGQMRVGGALAVRVSLLGFVVSELRVFGVVRFSCPRHVWARVAQSRASQFKTQVVEIPSLLPPSLVTAPPLRVVAGSDSAWVFPYYDIRLEWWHMFCCDVSISFPGPLLTRWTVFRSEKSLPYT